MTNEIQILNNVEFGQVRILMTESNEPMFCLADLCSILELNPSDVKKRLTDDVVTIHPILDSLGREQMANFVDEDGFYDVFLDSRKPEARKFRKWITKEVLPSLRKTGTYSLKPMTQAEMNYAMAQVQVEQEKKINALEMQQTLFDDELKSVSNEITEIKGKIRDNGFMSVMGFANNYKINIGTKKGAEIGRMASRWCKQMGILPEKVKHERWGKVNTYPTQALKDVFKAIYPNKSRLFDVPTLWD